MSTHPREPQSRICHDHYELMCPWCGEKCHLWLLPSGEPTDRPPEWRYQYPETNPRTWIDMSGRAWHTDCADRALAEYGRGIVDVEPVEVQAVMSPKELVPVHVRGRTLYLTEEQLQRVPGLREMFG